MYGDLVRLSYFSWTIRGRSNAMINVLAPVCYLGIREMSPFGPIKDIAFNQKFTTAVGITFKQIPVSCYDVFFLHSIYVYVPGVAAGTVQMKMNDGEGFEIFTDFFLPNPSGTDPFPLLPPTPFRRNDLITYEVLDAVGGHQMEVCFRGYTVPGTVQR